MYYIVLCGISSFYLCTLSRSKKKLTQNWNTILWFTTKFPRIMEWIGIEWISKCHCCNGAIQKSPTKPWPSPSTEKQFLQTFCRIFSPFRFLFYVFLTNSTFWIIHNLKYAKISQTESHKVFNVIKCNYMKNILKVFKRRGIKTMHQKKGNFVLVVYNIVWFWKAISKWIVRKWCFCQWRGCS